MQSLGLFIILLVRGSQRSPFQHFSWQCVFFYYLLLDLVLPFYIRMHRIALLVTFDLILTFTLAYRHLYCQLDWVLLIFTLYTGNTQYLYYDTNVNTNTFTF